jgi:hypothetical protein
MRLLILDFDDTLFFTGEAIAKASFEILKKEMQRREVRALPGREKGKIYDLAFSKYRTNSKPNAMLIRRIASDYRDYRILILSARSEKLYKDTEYLLREYGIPFHEIMLRDETALHMDDEKWKADYIKGILNDYEHVHLYEDKEDNIEYIRNALGRGAGKVAFFLVRSSMEGGVEIDRV